MDDKIKQYAKEEFNKRNNELCLIASENYPSQDVLNASGSIFQLKYAEGFAGKRYYQGCEVVDKVEQECIDTCLKLFGAEDKYLANVQPNSGASANMIVYNSILDPGDFILAPDVKSGGHISHSHPKSFISKYHNVITYDVTDDGILDYDQIEELATGYLPKLIICGASNYPRKIDFAKFKNIANKIGAYLMADIAHISLLVAKGLHPSPIGFADFITFTTHKMIKGPRGGVILYKKKFDKQIKLSTIPGLFGGPLEHQIYAKLVCFSEALKPESKKYAEQIIKNAQAIATVFEIHNIPIVSGKTENHLMTIDLSNYDISGRELAIELEKCGIICNCNTIPNDPRSFMETSGIRIGTPAITTRGFDEVDSKYLAQAMAFLIDCYRKDKKYESEEEKQAEIKHYENFLSIAVYRLCERYPLSKIYPDFVLTTNKKDDIIESESEKKDE